jgi:hypothetical protein
MAILLVENNVYLGVNNPLSPNVYSTGMLATGTC